jgi:16S rRNA (cytidine1402-2'-O)-methyltransferase
MIRAVPDLGNDGGVSGQLFLAGTPIGNIGDASVRLREILEIANVIAAEDSRRAHRLLSDLGITTGAQIWSFYDAVEEAKSPELISHVLAGETVVMISDAGMPSVSDPGYRLVQEAIAANVKVSVIPGPSAVLAALAVSGLPVDRFTFEGFLPHKKGRKTRIGALAEETRTMIFYESPHRLMKTLEQLADVFGPDRIASVSRELTKIYEENVRGSFAELITYYQENPIKGEIVLVVQGKN